MFPTLLNIGPVTIYSQGVVLILAYLLALFLVWKKGREEHFDEEELVSTSFWILALGLVGSRLGFVFFRLGYFGFDVWQWLNFRGEPGWGFWGGLLGGGLALWLNARRRHWQFLKIADIMVIGLAFGQSVVRLGNFLAGSFYGRTTKLFFGIKFPGLTEKHHPLSVYEMILFFILGLILLKLEKEYRTFEWYKNKRGEARPGFILTSWLMGVGLIRFISGLAEDQTRILFNIFTLNQIISLLIVIFSFGLIYWLSEPDLFKKLSKRSWSSGLAGKRIKRGLDVFK